MNVLLDTPVWSTLFRRSVPRLSARESAVRSAAIELVEQSRARIIGPIRQELLSGIRDLQQFERFREHMRGFVDEPIFTEDYEVAARHYNSCRTAGIAGSTINLLLCAVAQRKNWQLFTLDKDFQHYARVISFRLFTF